jgi:Zn-dependent protease with chaperone function
MTQKHTPGQWTITKFKWSKEDGLTSKGNEKGIQTYTGNGVDGDHIIIASKEAFGSSYLPGDFLGANIARLDFSRNSEKEAEANAKIIASAPMMLEALQKAFFAISVEDAEAYDAVEQAIKKATE